MILKVRRFLAATSSPTGHLQREMLMDLDSLPSFFFFKKKKLLYSIIIVKKNYNLIVYIMY